MVVFPHCKINLGLNIIEKRLDGYHNLETCFYPVPWTDVLEVILSEKFSFTTSGNPIQGNPEDNLCVKAYRLLQKQCNLRNVRIHLHKIIPMGAGLGGGSSDGAYTLLLLNETFKLGLNQHHLLAYASQLGSDCSFFVENRPKIGTARGEILQDTSVSLKGKFLVIIKPDVYVSTADAFTDVKPKKQPVDIKNIVETRPVEEWKNILRNDFEESVFKKYPRIEELKNQLYNRGAIYASMSGSGSSVYGIFQNETDVSEFDGLIKWTGMLE